jgi:UDP-N-acetylglucosamine:LPS N-acetylglucosamine transferase
MAAARPVILILTIQNGGGHMNLAQSLKETLEAQYEVVINEAQSGAANRWYAWISRYSIRFLHWQYVFTDNRLIAFAFHLVLTFLNYRRIKGIIERVRPQLIITTQAFLSYAAARVNEHQHECVPLVFQLTDLGQVHMTYFTERHAAAYLAPTREIFAQAQKLGIEKERLHLTGRPIRRQFLEVLLDARSETLASLGLDPALFTMFLQGGAAGSAGAEHIIADLMGDEVPVQIILAAGNNKKIAERYAGHKHVRVLPFTEEIAPYMAASDVIVGKAGASFISEAFTLEKPFIATTFIPGQETPNLRFIEQHNLGWVCLERASRQELFIKIVNSPKMLAEKVESIRAYNTWNRQANQDTRSILSQYLYTVPEKTVNSAKPDKEHISLKTEGVK